MTLKNKLILVLILLGLLSLGGCNLFKVYDIEGTWAITKTVGGETITFFATFEGSRESGLVESDFSGLGTYRVEYDTDLRFTIGYFDENPVSTDHQDTFTGGFDDTDSMSGQVDAWDNQILQIGAWTAIRQEPTL